MMQRLIPFLLVSISASALEMSEHGINFSVRAPKSTEVMLRLQGRKEPVAMQKDGKGTWHVSLSDVLPGVWEYSFSVDGVNFMDSSNPLMKPQREPGKSILHVPSSPPAPWDWQDLPHGAVHSHQYQCKATGGMRELIVYTPPSYSAASAPLPLLVLQHGSGDNQQTWVQHGKAHWILDSLIHAKKAKPMIVMMLDGHPIGKLDRMDEKGRSKSVEVLEADLIQEALPLVEREYRVAKEPSQRAIAGLSMGGFHAITLGLNHLDTFSTIASFSGAPVMQLIEKPLADAAGTNAKLKLFWIACGKEDFLLQRNEELVDELKQKGVKHEWLLTEGDHSWPVWRNYLADLAPRLFQ